MNKFVVAVEYLDNRGPQYDFFCNIEGIKKGDTVVARSRHGLGICRVLAIKNYSNKANAWIISKVDEKGHQERLEVETKQAQLVQGMRDRLNSIQESLLFQAVAQLDGEMHHMLSQWMELENKKNGRG